ncbi:MAG: hypothetical protein HYV60_12380, partial [Planctomycetia bacterium]|nr:hypothetical protein [Planctomycetia bacterium]
MMRFQFLWSLLLVVSAGLPVAAQTSAPPRIQPTMIGKDPRGLSERPLQCYIHVQDAPALEGNGKPTHRLNFLDQYYVADLYPKVGQPTHAYLAKPIDRLDLRIRQHVGWVPWSLCLCFTGAGPLALRDKETLIDRKAMLVTYLRDAPASTSKGFVSSTPQREVDAALAADVLRRETGFFDRPETKENGALELCRKGLFEIYYVYDETNTHLFLGSERNVPGENRRQEILLGWVPKSRLCQWNTREAVEFNKRDITERTQPALVFFNENDLSQFLNATRPPTLDELRAREPKVLIAWEELKTCTEWPHNLPRYPILGEFGQWPSNAAYKVGIIGHVYGSQQQLLLTEQQLRDLQDKADRLMQGVSTIQIAFLIDATDSMREWFPVAQQAVKRIFDEVRNLNADKVQVERMSCAVHFYRSDKEREIGLMLETHPFGDERDAIGVLDSAKALGGESRQEIFAAIFDSLTKQPFQPEATKILIVIGDGGDGGLPGGKTGEQIA